MSRRAALVVAGLFVAGASRAAPPDPLHLRGGTVVTLAVDAAHAYDGVAPDEAMRRIVGQLGVRAAPFTDAATVRARGTTVEIELPGVQGADATRAVAALVRSGRFAIQRVDDGAPFMRDAVARLAKGAVHGGVDQWSDGRTGALREDPYLAAPTRERLVAALAHLAVPADHEIAFGRMGSSREASEWRTYYLLRRAGVTGDRIASCNVAAAPFTRQPQVAVTFDRDGARAFEAFTEDSIGRKVAILVDGTIQTAPVVMTKIAGGHVLIALGPDRPEVRQQALDLVAVLRAGALAAPVRLVGTRTVPRR